MQAVGAAVEEGATGLVASERCSTSDAAASPPEMPSVKDGSGRPTGSGQPDLANVRNHAG